MIDKLELQPQNTIIQKNTSYDEFISAYKTFQTIMISANFQEIAWEWTTHKLTVNGFANYHNY